MIVTWISPTQTTPVKETNQLPHHASLRGNFRRCSWTRWTRWPPEAHSNFDHLDSSLQSGSYTSGPVCCLSGLRISPTIRWRCMLKSLVKKMLEGLWRLWKNFGKREVNKWVKLKWIHFDTPNCWIIEWMCNTAREIEAATQPLCQSGWTRMKGVQPCKGIVFSCVLYCFIYSFNCLQLSPFFIFLVNLFVFVCWPGTCSQPRTRTLLKSQKGRPSAERSASRDSMKDDSFAARIRILRNRTDIPRAIHVFLVTEQVLERITFWVSGLQPKYTNPHNPEKHVHYVQSFEPSIPLEQEWSDAHPL
jgi:hypothetical protein